MTKAPEPEDKLDAVTDVVVNGPEDAPFDWRQVNWRRVEDEVTLFNPAAVRTTRYRYRGAAIPSPWASAP